jgi:hypothetical protein
MSVLFPDVPNYPGVPQLARLSSSVANTVAPISIQATGLINLFGAIFPTETWGIFDSSGNAVVTPDTFLDFEHHPRWKISDFPVQGTATNPVAFASYNKVKLPFDCRVRMAIGSTLAARQQLLTALDTAADSINLYTILTPERTYQNCDIEYYDVVRANQGLSADGAYFLNEIDVYFKQIIPVQAQYSTTQLQNATNPSALPQSVSGNVLPQDVAGQYAALANGASLDGANGSF